MHVRLKCDRCEGVVENGAAALGATICEDCARLDRAAELDAQIPDLKAELAERERLCRMPPIMAPSVARALAARYDKIGAAVAERAELREVSCVCCLAALQLPDGGGHGLCEGCLKSGWREAYDAGDGPTAAEVLAVAAELDRRDALASQMAELDRAIEERLAPLAPDWMSPEDAAVCVRSLAVQIRLDASKEAAALGEVLDELDAPRAGESLEDYHGRAALALLAHYLAVEEEDGAAELREVLDHLQARAVAALRAELDAMARRQDDALGATISAVGAIVQGGRPAALADALRCLIQALSAPLEALEAPPAAASMGGAD